MDRGEWARLIWEWLGRIGIPVFIVVFSAIAGFVFGRARDFRKAKQTAYVELLPVILKFAYNRVKGDEEAYTAALARMWLYGSKQAALSMDHALGIIHEKGDVTRALQLAVADMRKDIQLWPWQHLNPKDVQHLYTRIVGETSGAISSSLVQDSDTKTEGPARTI